MNADWISGCAKPSAGFKRVDQVSVDYGMYGNRYKFQIVMPSMNEGTCPTL